MAESPQQVSSSSSSEKQALSIKAMERTKELKAKRDKINEGQDSKEADFKRIVEKSPKISDFPNSTKVKISRELSNLMAEKNNSKKVDPGIDEEVVERHTQQKPQSVKPDTGSTSDAFFQRMASLQNEDNHTARDSLQGRIKLSPPTRSIDIVS
ncbi:MAG: hypothetical protein HQL71_04870 [Magnetococcales bacterium]|nr:hypothetical protein [Magnetococcales bacterium]